MMKHTKKFLTLMLVLGSSALVMSAREKRRTNNIHTRNMKKGQVWKKVQGKMHAARSQNNRHTLKRTGPRNLYRFANNRNIRGPQIHTNLGRMQNRLRDQSQLEHRNTGWFDWIPCFFGCEEEEEEGEKEEMKPLSCAEKCHEHDFKIHGVRMKCLQCCSDTVQIEETDKVVTKADIVEDEEENAANKGPNAKSNVAARNLEENEPETDEVSLEEEEPAQDEIYDCVNIAVESLIKEQIVKLDTPKKNYKDLFGNILMSDENIKKIEEEITIPNEELEEEGEDENEGDDVDDSETQDEV